MKNSSITKAIATMNEETAQKFLKPGQSTPKSAIAKAYRKINDALGEEQYMAYLAPKSKTSASAPKEGVGTWSPNKKLTAAEEAANAYFKHLVVSDYVGKKAREIQERKDNREDFLNFAGNTFMRGVNEFNAGITSTLNSTFGKGLETLGWKNNPVQMVDDYYQGLRENYKEAADTAIEGMGGGEGWKIAGDLLSGTVAAAPDAVLAFMTGGTSKIGQIANVGAKQGANIITKAGMTVDRMVKTPSFWTSFARTYGSDYEEAKRLGADDVTAAFGATFTSFINAGIEIGFESDSGFQGVVSALKEGDNRPLYTWLKSMHEEGGEEVLQGFVNKLVAKTMYDSNVELPSLEEMAQEYGMGVGVSAILGGGQIVANNAIETANEAKAEYRSTEQEYSVKKMIKDFAIETAVKRNVSEDVYADVADVACRLGVVVRFASNEEMQVVKEDGTVSIPEGRFDPASQMVVLNANLTAKEAVERVIKHELTHSIQGTPQWKQLERAVRAQYGDAAFETKKAEITERYAGKGIQIDDRQATREVVAEWVGENLYNGRFFEAVKGGDATGGNVVRRTIDRVRLALGGVKNSRTAGDIALLERLFMRALENKGGNVQTSAVEQYAVSLGMTEQQRYEELKDRTIVAIEDRSSEIEDLPLEELENRAKSKAEKAIYPLAEKLGILGRGLSTPELDISFELTKGKGLKISLSHQLKYGGSYADFAKALINLDVILQNAVLVELHTDKYKGTVRESINLLDTAVLVGAYKEGKFIVPVQFEVKRLRDSPNKLYLVIAMTKIEADVMGVTSNVEGQSTRNLISASTYRIADIFKNINPRDAEFLKYIPDGFLNDEQKAAKQAALSAERKRIDSYPKKKQQFSFGDSQFSFESELPDVDDVIAEVEDKVAEIKVQKQAKSAMKRSASREALLDDFAAGKISRETLSKQLAELEHEAVAENDKKWRTGNRGTAAEKAHVKRANEAYRESKKAEYAKKDEAIKSEKQKIREQEDAKECTRLRGEIQRNVDELTAKLARPSKNRYVPGDMVAPIADLLEIMQETDDSVKERAFALQKKIAEATDEVKKARYQRRLDNLYRRRETAIETLEKIRAVYKKYDGGEECGEIFDRELYGDIERVAEYLQNRDLQELSVEETKYVLQVIHGIAHRVNNSQKMICKEYRATIHETGDECIQESREAKQSFKGLMNQDLFQKIVNWQLTPDRFFSMLAGFKKDSCWHQVYLSFKEGQKRYFSVLREFDKVFAEIFKHKEYRHLADSKTNKLVDIGLLDTNGNAVPVTRDIMLGLYANISANIEEVLYSAGLVIPDTGTYNEYGICKDAYTKGTRLTANAFSVEMWEVMQKIKTAETPAEVQQLQSRMTELAALSRQSYDNVLKKIESMLTPMEKELLAKADTWFNSVAKDRINETTVSVLGYPKTKNGKYFRIRRNTDFVETESSALTYNETIEAMGPLQERVKSKAPILVTGLIDELISNSKDVARIYGFMAPETDFRRLLNVRDKNFKESVKDSLRQFGSEKGNVGVSATKYIDNLLADMTFGRTFEKSPVGWAYRNSVRAVMTLNPRVAMVQFAAGPTAAAELGWGNVLKSAPYFFKKPPVELIKKYSTYGYMRNRDDGGMQEFSDARQGHTVFDRAYNKVDRATDGRVLGWCQLTDRKIVNTQWFACEKKIQAEYPELKVGSEAYYTAVGEALDDVIIKTQSNGTVLESSDLLRNKSQILRPLTMFKTDTIQQFNILFESVMTARKYAADYKAGKNGITAADVKDSKKRLANGITAVAVGGVVSATVFRAVANFLLQNMDKYRDEYGEITVSSMLNAATREMMGSMAGWIVFGDYIYEVVEARVFGDRYFGISDTALGMISDLLTSLSKKDYTKAESWGKTVIELMNCMGVPYKNGKNMVEALLAHVKDIENGEFLSMNASNDSSMAQQYQRLYKYLRQKDAVRVERIKRELTGAGETENDILSGIRDAVKKSGREFDNIYNKMVADVSVTALYDQLTTDEQSRVKSKMKSYVADSIISEYMEFEKQAEHEKAELHERRGLSLPDFFVAQVAKNSDAADKNGDDKINKAEYARLLRECGYDGAERARLLSVK